jgi:Domain of unknown function (DUF5658)
MVRLATVFLASALSAMPAAAQVMADRSPTPVVSYSFDVQRDVSVPPSLTDMYLKHAALQSLDVLTTVSALSQGHAEANPILGKGHTAAIVGAKVAAMSASVYLTQKLWKRNPKAAMVTMVVTNAVLSAVIVNNSAVLRR